VSRKLKVLDLFSGIGGFALGLDSTGFFETVKFVEKDKYCQKVLRKNFPNIPIEEDIKNVEGKEYSADVVVGGFPCQPFSVAGKQKGTNDDRYLWPEMLRLIREIKPEFVIGENVQGLVNLQNGMVLRQVQDQLESEGFEVQCFLIPASGIGAWHQRYRVWIVGHSQHNGLLAAEKRCRDEKDYGGSQKGKNETVKFERTSGSRDNEDVSNTERKRLERHNEHSSTLSRENERSQFGSTNSSRSSENVSDTEIIGTRESRNINQEEGNESSSSTQSNSSSEDVSNTDSGMRGGWRTIGESRENKVWRFYSEEEKQTRFDIRSETIGRDAVSGEDVSYTEHEGLQGGQRNNKGEGRQILSPEQQNGDEVRSETGRIDGVQREDVSDTSSKRLQRRDPKRELQEQKFGFSSNQNDETKQTWWQIESDLCGVPNGISYELDKDRANRIKTLGNAIVPQIAREFGLAIKKVLSDEDII